ncbi:hypothetical protein [Polyangium mundeleinium]|uniref:Uncharacterized protein n=1 Tax=Polyangium mundeleinium TaxID=2995306 RepID=A0ABT5F0K2_9BACT|nr:hypothetical protein [Polyangium mundeleinium]MDC0747604.1 hypothetical protein [Polyangium mundeleinium]
MGFLGGGTPENVTSNSDANSKQVSSPDEGSAVKPCPCDPNKTMSPQMKADIDAVNQKLDTAIENNQKNYDAKVARYAKENWPHDENIANIKARGEALKQRKKDLNDKINECACYGDGLMNLANVVYNEAGSHSMNAKTAVAYAYMNRTQGNPRAPVSASEISHYKSIGTRAQGVNDSNAGLFAKNMTESIEAACRRLRDKDPTKNDPTNGSTHWVSPDALPKSANGCGRGFFAKDGRCFPTWTDADYEPNVRETLAEGVPRGEFIFYRGVRY